MKKLNCGDFLPVPPAPVIANVSVFDGVVAADCKRTKAFKTTLNYNPLSFIKSDNKVYNPEISQLSILLSTDIYAHCSVTFEGEQHPLEDTLSIYDKLSFKNPEYYELKKEDYTEDKNDLTSAVFSHQEYCVDGKNYSIIFAVIRGTDGTFEQWCSNFDIGPGIEDLNDDFYKRTGNHNDWKIKKNHKGLDIAANRLNEYLSKYLTDYTDFEDITKILLITGHSRGAGIANILGKIYESSLEYKTFTYTFGGPRATTVLDNSASTIFNIINKDDIVPFLTPDVWGFKNYGTDVFSSVQSDYKKWEEMLGVKYKSARKFIDRIHFNIDKRIGDISINTADFYAADKSKRNTLKNRYFFASRKYVESQIEEIGLRMYFDGLDYKNKLLSGNFCPIYINQALAQTVSTYTQGGMKKAPEIFKFILIFYPRHKVYVRFASGVIRAGSFMSNFSLQRSHSVTSYILLSQLIR